MAESREEKIAKALRTEGCKWEWRHLQYWCGEKTIPKWLVEESIRQRVRELATFVDYYYRPKWCEEYNSALSRHEVVVYVEGSYYKAKQDTEAAAWEEALLWLTRKENERLRESQ